MRVEDCPGGSASHEKAGRHHEMPVHHTLWATGITLGYEPTFPMCRLLKADDASVCRTSLLTAREGPRRPVRAPDNRDLVPLPLRASRMSVLGRSSPAVVELDHPPVGLGQVGDRRNRRFVRPRQ
jgi:hypothetical protein